MGVELRISRFEFPCSRPRFFQCYFERQFYCFQNGTFKQRLRKNKIQASSLNRTRQSSIVKSCVSLPFSWLRLFCKWKYSSPSFYNPTPIHFTSCLLFCFVSKSYRTIGLLPLSKTVSNIDNDVGSSENKSKNLKLFLIIFERSIAILKILTNVDQRWQSRE